MVGGWVGAGSTYVVHDANELVGLGKKFVKFPVTGNRAFGVVGLCGRAVAGMVSHVTAV